MTAETRKTAVELLKTRLNRASVPGPLNDYLVALIDGNIEKLAEDGINLTDSTSDVLLLVDYSAWRYYNRDKPEGMPPWLRLIRRERWLKDKFVDNTGGCNDS